MICLDTNVLIWAVQDPPPPGAEALAARTRRYLAAMHQQGERIALPVIVMAEYLAFFEEQPRRQQERIIERRFEILSLTPQAGQIAARILSQRAALLAAQHQTGHPRQAIRVDAFMVAIAAANQATLVSHDAGVLALGGLVAVPVIQVPVIQEQGDLFNLSPP